MVPRGRGLDGWGVRALPRGQRKPRGRRCNRRGYSPIVLSHHLRSERARPVERVRRVPDGCCPTRGR